MIRTAKSAFLSVAAAIIAIGSETTTQFLGSVHNLCPEDEEQASRVVGVQRRPGYSRTTSLPLRHKGPVMVGLAGTARKTLVAVASLLTHPVDRQDLPMSLSAAKAAVGLKLILPLWLTMGILAWRVIY